MFRQQSRGFTLVEVLVAVSLLAVGLIGLAALQAKVMRYGQNAYLTSQAALLAYDVADRMRANRSGVVGGFYTGAAADNNCVSDEAAKLQACTPAQLAADDLFHWQNAVTAALPKGAATITRPTANQCINFLLITITWNLRDFNAAANNADQTYSLCLTKV